MNLVEPGSRACEDVVHALAGPGVLAQPEREAVSDLNALWAGWWRQKVVTDNPKGGPEGSLWPRVDSRASADPRLHWTGAAWFSIPVDTRQSLLAVWGSPAGDLWAVGERAVAVHWDGVDWAVTPPRPLTQHLLAVNARKPDDVWAAGSHGTVAHWDGKLWQQQSVGHVTLRATWSLPDGYVWIVGSGGTVLECSRWLPCRPQGSDERYDFETVWGSAYNDIWVAGAGGILRHLKESFWETVPVPTTADLRSIWGAASDDVWIATRSDVVLHWDGSNWTSTSVPGSGEGSTSWQLIFGSAADDIWLTGTATWSAYKAGGVNAVAKRWNGQAWSTTSPLAYLSAAQVIALPTAAEIWVVSPGLWGYGNPDTDERENQTGVGHWDGSEWSGSQTGSRNPLYGISASGPHDIWAVGARGTICVVKPASPEPSIGSERHARRSSFSTRCLRTYCRANSPAAWKITLGLTTRYALAIPSRASLACSGTPLGPTGFIPRAAWARFNSRYTPGPYRASDHDPVIVSLNLTSAPKIPTCNRQPATIFVAKDGKVVGGRAVGRGDDGDFMVPHARPPPLTSASHLHNQGDDGCLEEASEA